MKILKKPFMKKLLFIISLTGHINALQNHEHHYMTIHDKYGKHYEDELNSYIGGSGYKIVFFNLPKDHHIGYSSNVKKKITIYFEDCKEKIEYFKINSDPEEIIEPVTITSEAKDSIFIFERCNKNFFETHIKFKRNIFSHIDENTMLLKLIFKDCLFFPKKDFFKNLISNWKGKEIQICGNGLNDDIKNQFTDIKNKKNIKIKINKEYV